MRGGRLASGLEAELRCERSVGSNHRPALCCSGHDEVEVVVLFDHGTSFSTDEECGEVVPRVDVGVARLEVPIEGTISHEAHLEAGSPESPVLRPPVVLCGKTRERNDRIAQVRGARWRNGLPVTSGSPAAHRSVGDARRLVADVANEGAIVVEHAQAGREEGHAVVAVGGAINGIHDAHEPTFSTGPA